MSDESNDQRRVYVRVDPEGELNHVFEIPANYDMTISKETAQRLGETLMSAEEYHEQYPDKVDLRQLGGVAILELLSKTEAGQG